MQAAPILPASSVATGPAIPAPIVDPSLDTLPKLLLRNAKQFGERPAVREKDLGIWQTWSWVQVLDEVRALAIGFSRLGLARGDTIAIIGDNRPRLYWSLAAAQSIGAIPVPIYQDSVADEMASIRVDLQLGDAALRSLFDKAFQATGKHTPPRSY